MFHRSASGPGSSWVIARIVSGLRRRPDLSVAGAVVLDLGGYVLPEGERRSAADGLRSRIRVPGQISVDE